MILLYSVSIFMFHGIILGKYNGKCPKQGNTMVLQGYWHWSVLVQMELEALRSIYEGDDCFKELSSVSFQFRVRTDSRHVQWCEKSHKYTKYCLLWLTVMFYLAYAVQIKWTQFSYMHLFSRHLIDYIYLSIYLV